MRAGAFAIVAVAWLGAAAQETTEPAPPTWTVSGEVRLRPEWRDDLDLRSGPDDDRREVFSRVRVGILGVLGERVRLFAQVQDSRVFGEESSTTSNERNLDLHQGWLELRGLANGLATLTLGRQEWVYGDQRLIGNFGWNNVGRSFDGARLRLARGPLWLDTMAARITSRTLGTTTEGSDLFGLYAHAGPREASEYEAYVLSFVDRIDAAGELGTFGDTAVHALGARVREHRGPLDGTLEVVGQTGEQRGDDLSAFAGALVVGASFGERPRTRLFAGYDHATGDEDPTDGEREEFFNFFPTNHPHYGYADLMGWRNVRSPSVGASVTWGPHMAQAKVHRFRLEEARGPWKDAAGNVLGFDPTGAAGTRVGDELDLLYRLRWTPAIALEAGYSRFWPDRFAELTRGPDAMDWAYVMLTVAF